ncbi:MAG: bifunctional hydroxymethylpyrimidine kinase/phosphomethylpyrimidine kinase [Paludibacteraceae bacterium]|nr:bifunctional hydroxymethylpyrimidine kinase/phosphomethylpyrimidine kinase [Paludibacteraceae bacterium]
MKSDTPILSITGSDGFGETGIQSDIQTISELGGHPLSIITSVSVEKGDGSKRIFDLPVEIVTEQAQSIIEKAKPKAIKIGLIRDAQAIRRLRNEVIACKTIVCDPGIISSDGTPLVRKETLEAIKKHLIPISTLLIIKCEEAKLLLGKEIFTDDDMVATAEAFSDMGAEAIMLRGGHQTEGRITTLLYHKGRKRFFSSHNMDGWQKHGVSGALSSAIAVRLALGDDIPTAIRNAHDYIHSQVVYAVPSPDKAYRNADLYNQLMSLISEHYRHAHDVAYYADQLSITPRYLSQVTNKAVGKTPKQVIDNYLIQESIQLLETSRLTIQEVADKLGFTSQAMFCKFFRHYEKVSPSQFRKSSSLCF